MSDQEPIDLRLITTKVRDANSKIILYDGWNVGYVVASMSDQKWPDSANPDRSGVPIPTKPGKVYWAICHPPNCPEVYFPPTLADWQAHSYLASFFFAGPAKKEAVYEVARARSRYRGAVMSQSPAAQILEHRQGVQAALETLKTVHGGY